MALGQIIRKRRNELELTLDYISNRTGYTKPYISTIETGRVKNPPGDELLVKLEKLLNFEPGLLVHIAHLEKLPADVREAFEESKAENEHWRTLIKHLIEQGGNAEELLQTEQYSHLVEQIKETEKSGSKKSSNKTDDEIITDNDQIVSVPIAGKLVPVINNVMAGYPADYDDLGYPPGGADDYVRCPDLHDPNAFAVRVVGDSMEPKYNEGDIVIFSPSATVDNGDDCFVRMRDPHETTFKQVFFEEEQIRLQPRNHKYSPIIMPQEKVNGVWRAVIRYERLNQYKI